MSYQTLLLCYAGCLYELVFLSLQRNYRIILRKCAGRPEMDGWYFPGCYLTLHIRFKVAVAVTDTHVSFLNASVTHCV